MPRPYDPNDPEMTAEHPDDNAVVTAFPRAQADTPAPAPTEITERWAFSSNTIKRMLVAGVMFLISQKFVALVPFIDQGLVADAVSMVFDTLGVMFLGWAAKGRKDAGLKDPEHLYWLPRKRA